MAPNRTAVKNNGTKPDVLNFDLDDLTIDELDMLEEVTGEAFDSILAPGKPKAKAMRAIAYVIKRRTDPEFTLEQAGRLKITMDSLPDPTKADDAS